MTVRILPTPLTVSAPATEVDAELKIVRLFATVMDEAVTIPGTNMKIGLDPILGFIPVIGDLGSAAVGAYLLRAASRLGVPGVVQARMLLNVLIDTVLGLVPFVGDYLDIMYKANAKNAALIINAVENRKTAGRSSWFTLISVFLAFIVIVVGGFVGTVMLAKWAWNLVG